MATNTGKIQKQCSNLSFFSRGGGGEGLSPTFIKSAAKESAFREKGTEKATENHKLGRTIGVDKLREEREMGTWSRVGFKDRKKLIVGRGGVGKSTRTATLPALSDLRGTACLI